MIKTITLHFLLTEAFVGVKGERLFFNKTIFLLFALLLVLMPLWRLLVLNALKYYRRSGFNFCNVVIVGGSDISSELKEFFEEHPEHGYRFQGYYTPLGVEKEAKGTVEDFLFI